MPTPTTLRAGKAGDSTAAYWADKQGYIVKFTHQPTGHIVEFPATLQSFSDTHTPKYSEQYGADTMDPTIILSSTDRNVSFSFTVLNSSLEEARHNTQCVNLLIQMLYPLLDSDGTILGNPYITIEVMNLAQSAVDSSGILCIIDSIDYDMQLKDGVISHDNGELHPISLEISISATAVLERDAKNSSTFLPNTYPSYGG
tara:strand:- start:5015 stop:5614 length:600 start_codon:yes stop_codon:yes gene_type:complete